MNQDEICKGSCGEMVPVGHDGILTSGGRTVIHHKHGICHYIARDFCKFCAQEPSEEKKIDLYCGDCGFHPGTRNDTDALMKHKCTKENPRSWEYEMHKGSMAQVFCRINDREVEILKSFIRQLEQDTRKATLKECIDLSDKIEMSEPDGGTRQWMAFKCFRNTMRDKLKSKL